MNENSCKERIEELKKSLKAFDLSESLAVGESSIKDMAVDFYGSYCQRCGKKLEFSEITVHGKNQCLDSRKEGDFDLRDFIVLCRRCHDKLHSEIMKTQEKFAGIFLVEKGMDLILKGLSYAKGLNLKDKNFEGTPKRVARMFNEIFKSKWEVEAELNEILQTVFPCQNDEMVIQNNIKAWSMCPHHFMVVKLDACVAYIPEKGVLGLSKLARVVRILASRPILQETMTVDIVDYIMKCLKPLGAGVIVKGEHTCMTARGVRADGSLTITSALRGNFQDASVRAEFFKMVEDWARKEI